MMLLWLIPVFLLIVVVLVMVMSYFADKEYWLQRVREGSHSRTDFERDVKYFEEKPEEKPL